MNSTVLSSLRNTLIKGNFPVSKLEYTNDNYDDQGNLIKESLPTLTTDFCEIGLNGDETYFVFILKSSDFDLGFFQKIKDIQGIQIYGLKNFNKTLYPSKNFNSKIFLEEVNSDNYLQIQFAHKSIRSEEIFNEYLKLVNLFEKNNIDVINQLKVDLIS